MQRDNRVRHDALATLEKYNAATDPRHVRREATPEELLCLISTTEQRPYLSTISAVLTGRWSTGWLWGPVCGQKNCEA
jgi:hypothetical protein